MIVYYLSGPMRGFPDHNYPAFFEVEEALAEWLSMGTYERDDGFEIVNPARNFDGDQTRDPVEYMQADLQAVLEADVIVLLPGWEKSEGALRETALAEWTGKKFMLAARGRPNDALTDQQWMFASIDGLPSKKLSPRADALAEAQALITGDRNNQYGPPTQDFQRAAQALNAYGYRALDGRLLRPHDVAVMVMAVKLSRLMWTPGKRDHWIDIAGYAGCGYECATEEATT